MKYKLKNIFDLQMGKTPSRNNTNYWNTNDYEWISIADLSKTEKYITHTKEYLSALAIEESGIKVIPANTVVMSFKLSIGKTAITGKDMYCNEAIMAFHDKHVVDILPEYIYYMFKYRNWDNGSNKAVMGKTLNKSTLSEVEIDICSIEKQKEIVTVLDKVMESLSSRKKEMALLDELVRGRFVELFGNPVKNEKNWETFKLRDCLKRIDSGKSFTCDVRARTGERPAILKLSAITYGDYRAEENKALLDEKQFIDSAEIQSGDLLFTRKNTPELVGMAAYVYHTPAHLMMPDLIFRLVPNERMTAIFLWQLINNRDFRPVIQSIAVGSAKSMSNISKERLGNVSVICPPIDEQTRLNEMVHQINKSKLIVQKELDETQLLFDSLMQEYFG